MMEEEQQGLKERSLELKLKERKETGGREERGRERRKTQTLMQSIMGASSFSAYGLLDFFFFFFFETSSSNTKKQN